MSARRNRGDEEGDIIGSRKPAADNGPLFGESPTVTIKRDPVMDARAPLRANVPPAARQRCDQCKGGIEGERDVNIMHRDGVEVKVHRSCTATWMEARKAKRARMPADVALKGETARGSETSAAAARAVDASVPTLAWLVLQHIRSTGSKGATRDETATALGKRLSSISARIRELYLMGHIGSNCIGLCECVCLHPRQTRTNAETGLENEVMLYETHVVRWEANQQRPPKPLRTARSTTAREREEKESDGEATGNTAERT